VRDDHREPGRHDDRDGKRDGGQQRPPSRRAKILLFAVGIGAVVAMALFVVLLHHHHSSADDKERQKRETELEQGPEIVVATATKAPATRTVVLPGDVRPWALAVVYARVSGYLSELVVDRGDHVTKDQVLGRVTTPETELQLRPLEANLHTKQVIANRLRPLVPKGVVSQQELDQADADVQAAASEVDRLQALKGFDAIRAPFDGIVTKRYVDIGALMPAPTGSTQSAQPLVDIADISRVRVVVYVGQRDATGIHVGDHLSVVRDDDPTHPIAAQVARLPTDLDLRTRTMWVEADLDNASGALYPGLFVTVTLDVPAPAGVLIPSDAIAIQDGKEIVALVKDGTTHFVPIEVADDDGRTARIVKGLRAGDRVASRVSDEIHDGGKIRPTQPKQQGSGSGGSKGSASEHSAGAGSAGSGSNAAASTGEEPDAPGSAVELKAAGSDVESPYEHRRKKQVTGEPSSNGSGAGGPT
jgi:RND family efflux transporter MFP subunit